jgi:TRAP-type mannitol/chloroaromatic compound transport system permease small subunit
VDTIVAAIRAIDRLNAAVGKAVSWLTLATVLICAFVVGLRYAVGTGYVWMQELYVWTHAFVFLLASGFAYMRNAHVRVDIFYAPASVRAKAWIDLFGVVFLLLPWLLILIWVSWSYVTASWHVREPSLQNNGMYGVYILKSAIVAFAVLLGLQGLAWIGRCILILSGREPPPLQDQGVTSALG